MNTVSDQRLQIAVCDSQPLVVEGLRSMFDRTPSYQLLEPANNLETLARQIVAVSPQVVLLDKTGGTSEVIEWLSRPEVRTVSVIVWGLTVTDSEALRFLQAGARGVICKTARVDTLLACLDAVANGLTWMDDNLFRSANIQNSPMRMDLTAREQQVLELVERGLRNKQIADELGIRPGTVKIHLKHIFEKSGVRGRYGLALSGLRDRFHAPVLSM